jgi:GWxTD domain-containing protein
MKMKKTFLFLLSFSLLFLFAFSKEKTKKILPLHYKNWLEKDVMYIITSKEKELFLQLESDKEREIFIEAFWKQRDPTPGTPENQFKEEHYRRMGYANEYFGRETTRAGWQTDRGRIYIILGPPLDITRYEGEGFVYPTRIWFYEAKPQYGLSSHFNLVFFKRKGIGEYVLYSPTQDGPASLIINYKADPSNVKAAYQQLLKYDSHLADVSISLIPEESPLYGQPSLASVTLINRIFSVPEKTVDWRYAEALLKYKDIIEVEYTANFINSESLVQVFRDESGIFFIHYSIEPEKLSVLSYEKDFRIHFKLNGIVKDLNENVIFQYEKTVPLHFNQDQIKDIQKTSIVIQDMIPLIAGDYKLSLLLKNTVSKEFTSFERDISIPEKLSNLQMSPLLLGYQLKRAGSQQNNKPFKIGNLQIACQARSIFHHRENLVIFFQMYGLTDKFREKGMIRYTFYRKDEEFLTQEKNLREFAHDNFFEEFSLHNFPADYFRIKVSVLDSEKREVLSGEKEFEISPLSDLPRPWIVSRVMPASQNIEYSFILGNQFAKKGYIKEAEKLLAKAYDTNQASLRYALSYAQILFKKKNYQRVKEILMPFSEIPQENHLSLSLLGASCQALEEYQKAISFYKEYLSHAGTNLNILNSIGECYYCLGNIKEALIAWKKSLEINPNQEDIKKIVNQLKRKN